jgi:hypothetical protein
MAQSTGIIMFIIVWSEPNRGDSLLARTIIVE